MKVDFKLSSLARWIYRIGLLILVVMTIMRLMLFLFFNSQGYSLTQLGDAFLLGLRYDLRALALILLVMIILGNIRGLRPFRTELARKIWLVFFAILIPVIIFFYIVDFAHYAYLAQRLNASALNYLHDARISMGMVWQSYPVVWLILLLLLVSASLWLCIRFFHRWVKKRRQWVSRRQRNIELITCILVFGMMIFGRFGQFPLRWSDAFSLGTDYKANLALNPFESFFNTLQFRASHYDAKRLHDLYPVLKPYYHFDTSSSKISFTRTVNGPAKPASSPNVVLIICESFSAYKSSFFGNPLPTTPFFDSLCRNGILFDRCFTPAYGTARGIWATLTGIPDVEMPATASRNPGAVDQQTIINSFKDHEKFYFLGGSASWANIRALLKNNIDGLTIYEQADFKGPKINVWGISDKDLFLEANKILAKKQKPFFAIIQTADNHRPYTVPDEDFRELPKFTISKDSLKKAGFESLEEFNAFRYTDYAYRKFFEAASKEKYFVNTIFVFVGDHGIPGNAPAGFPNSWTSQRLTVHHVPLLYYAPSLFGPRRIHEIGSQIDVLPTLAGLCNIPYVNSTLGRDLLDTSVKKHFAFLFGGDNRQVGIVDSQYLFVQRLNSASAGLYSITNNDTVSIDSARAREHSLLGEAMYEASKYLLLNNKKGKAR